MMQNLGICKGFFMIPAAASHDGVHSSDEVDEYIHKCVRVDTTEGMGDKSGIRNMWFEEAAKKQDKKGVLQQMLNQAERQKDTSYLTASMLGLMDTRLYSTVLGGVNTAFSAGSGRGQSANQQDAVKKHDDFLKSRIKYHQRCV